MISRAAFSFSGGEMPDFRVKPPDFRSKCGHEEGNRFTHACGNLPFGSGGFRRGIPKTAGEWQGCRDPRVSHEGGRNGEGESGLLRARIELLVDGGAAAGGGHPTGG